MSVVDSGLPRVDTTTHTPVLRPTTGAGADAVAESPRRPVERPRPVNKLTRADWTEYLVAAASALHLMILARVLLDWNGIMGSAITTVLVFIAAHYALVRQRTTAEVAADRAVTTVIWTVAALIVAVLGWMLTYLVAKGIGQLRPSFFTQDLRTTTALDEGGGAVHAIIGTAEQVGIAAGFAIPIAILTAVYLQELGGRLSKPIRFVIDALAGVPSIVAGLLIYTVWPGYSGFRASCALAVLILPTVTRASEEILRTVPDHLREASLALGAPQWRTVARVVLPTARAGLLTAGILGVARAAGETAPVALTALGNTSTNWNPFSGPQSSLPLFVYDLSRVPSARQIERAWTGCLILVGLVLVLFIIARTIVARSERRLGRR